MKLSQLVQYKETLQRDLPVHSNLIFTPLAKLSSDIASQLVLDNAIILLKTSLTIS